MSICTDCKVDIYDTYLIAQEDGEYCRQCYKNRIREILTDMDAKDSSKEAHRLGIATAHFPGMKIDIVEELMKGIE